MKKILLYIFSVILLFASTISCKDYLEITPKTILVDQQVWSSDDMVLSLLANLYNRIPVTSTIYTGNDQMSNYDDLMWTGLYEDNNYFTTYSWGFQNYWDWTYIRELNDFIEKATTATKLNPANQKLYIAEGRYLRANAYFEFVKKMGGVPLITQTYTYSDFLVDPAAVQIPRSKESDIYDFIATSIINGKIVYQGKTLSFRSNAMSLQLYQTGFDTYTSTNVSIRQDGTFTALMFDGNYRLINPSGTTQPWQYRSDTLKFELNGSASVDYEVTPYYIINDETFTKVDTSITTNCKIAKIVPTATLQYAALYIGRTSMVDQRYNESFLQLKSSVLTDLNNVNITAGIPKRLRDQGYCFVRIGVKPNQSSEWLYTQVQKITF